LVCARYRQSEFLYGNELEELHATAGWFTIRTAFSRDDAVKRVYVQHVMPQDAALLHQLLVTQRGHLYICGNRNLPAAVQVCARFRRDPSDDVPASLTR
jgi:sulfite reductase alpha subunit-like flavoprotein